MLRRKGLTSLAEAEKARLWAAPVNALRAAIMMRCCAFWRERRCKKINVETARTDGACLARKEEL